MSELKKVATRESYGKALAELAPEYPDLVVLDADLAAATKTGIFKKACPERFFDCGIAEGNMMGVAAGMAAAGKIVFASSFAMFAAENLTATAAAASTVWVTAPLSALRRIPPKNSWFVTAFTATQAGRTTTVRSSPSTTLPFLPHLQNP